MNPILSRRSLLESSLASLGAVRTGLRSFHDDGLAAVDQIPAGAFNVKEFGAKGDGSTDDARAFHAAIAAAGQVNGVVLVPASARKYTLGSSLTLAPNTTIQGAGAQSPTIRLNGGGESLFNFIGISEAQGLNVTLSNLALESGSNRKGTSTISTSDSGPTGGSECMPTVVTSFTMCAACRSVVRTVRVAYERVAGRPTHT